MTLHSTASISTNLIMPYVSSSTFLHHFQLMEYEDLQMPGFSQEMFYRWEMILRFPRVDDIDDS